MTSYDVTVSREGRWWMIAIPAIDGLTQTRRLSDIADTARSYVVVDQDVAPSDVEIRITTVSVDDTDVQGLVEELSQLRAAEDEAHRRYTELSRRIAHQLTSAEVPVRDVGELLGVSYQRAHQLAKAS